MEFLEQPIDQQLSTTRPSVIVFASKPKEDTVALASPMAAGTNEDLEQPIDQQLPTRPSVIMYAPKPEEDTVALGFTMTGITEKDLEEIKPEVKASVPVNNTENELDNNEMQKVEGSVEVNYTKKHIEIESDEEAMDEDIPEDETFLPREYKGRVAKNLDLVNPSQDDLRTYATDDKAGIVFDPKLPIHPDKFKLIQYFKSDKFVDLKEKASQNKAVAIGRIQKRASREKKYRLVSRLRHNQFIFRIGHLVGENMVLYNRLKNLILKQHELAMNMAKNGTETKVEEAGVEEIAANPGYLDMPDINPYPANTEDVKVSPLIDVEKLTPIAANHGYLDMPDINPYPINTEDAKVLPSIDAEEPEPVKKIEKIEESSEIILNEDPMNYAEGEVSYATFHYTLQE